MLWIVFFIVILFILVFGFLFLKDIYRIELEPHQMVCVHRFSKFYRTLTCEQAEKFIRLPICDTISAPIDARVRLIVLPFKLKDEVCKVMLKLQVEYQVVADDALALQAIEKMPQPVPYLVDFLHDKVPKISALLPKSSPEIFEQTMLAEINDQLTQHLAVYGYRLQKVVARSLRVLPNIDCDLSATHQVIEHLKIDAEQRDTAWWQQLSDVLPQANFAKNIEPVEAISATLYAYMVVVPEDEDFMPIAMRDVFKQCTEQGIGLGIKLQAGAQPVLSLSYAELVALSNGNYAGDILEQPIPQGPFYSADTDFIPMGNPSDDMLPSTLRHALHHYLERLKIEGPAVTLVAAMGGDLSMSLAFNVFREQFEDDAGYELFLRQFYWYLPRDIKLVGLSQQSSVATEMVLLQD